MHREALGASFVTTGKCEDDDGEIEGSLLFIQRQCYHSKIYSCTQRGEKCVETWESLSEGAKRGTSRWKWKRDDQNCEKELSAVVGEAECKKRGRGWRKTRVYES